MRTLGIIGLVCGAGAALLCCTERGRSLMSQARGMVQERLEALQGGGAEPRELVEGVLEQPHPETAMAQAFEEAVAA
jgi:hypothetical protein